MVGPELSGVRVNLRPLRGDDLPCRVKWLNDEETVVLFTGAPPAKPYELFEAERWRFNFETDPTCVVWAIETKWQRHIGDVDLHRIDLTTGTAKLTILIGDRMFWGHGYGTDAMKTLLKYAFTELGLKRVELRVFDFNKRAIRSYEKSGFVKTGSVAPGQLGYARPGEIHMAVTKESFLSEVMHSCCARGAG